MKILVTGVAGFIGHATAMRLLKNGHTVVGVDKPRDNRHDKAPRLEQLRNAGCNLCTADLSDIASARDVFAIMGPFDRVIHLSGQYSVAYTTRSLQDFIDGNLRSYLNVMDCARTAGVPRVLYASSTFVQENQLPWSMYGATLEFRERAANVYAEMGMETVGFRFGSTYGPHIRPDVGMYIIARKLWAGEPINVEEGGFKYRVAFVYIDDAVECLVRSLDALMPSRRQVFTLAAQDEGYDLGMILDLLERYSGKVARRVGNYASTPSGGIITASEPLRNVIGYVPGTSMVEGAKKFVAWFDKKC